MRFELRSVLVLSGLLAASAQLASSVRAEVHPPQKPPARGKTDPAPEVELELMDPALSAKDVKKIPGLKVKEAPSRRQATASALPDARFRDSLIERAGLKNETAKMDPLDRTVFFKHAEGLSLEEFKQKYPSMKSEKLDAFQSLVKGKKQ